MLLRLPATLLLGAFLAFAQTPEDAEYFEKNVRPLLAAKCQMCHSAELKTAELDLSSAEGFVQGGASGPLVNKEHPQESALLKVVSYDAALKMPPMGKLADSEIAVLKEWIDHGAHWPGAEQVEIVKPSAEVRFTAEQKAWWAFQSVKDPAPPAVKDESWAESPIDRFILAKLEEKSLAPAAAARKATLLRRASYDLTGMPPTKPELEAFLADETPEAFENALDRLLDSPRYGERWGREWLNVARYADSTGNDEDHRYPYAYRYRDYVIEAFNGDLPFDQFVREQIAGDLLPAADGGEINERGVVATGFLALGPKAVAQQDKTKMLYDVYDEQVDVVSKAVLGVTLACARCHDHKFDPLLQADYYAMVGVFANTRSFSDPSTHVSKLFFKPLVPSAEWKEYEAEQETIRKRKFELDNLADIEIEQHVETLAPNVAEYMLAAHRVYAGGADVAAEAAKAELQTDLLEKWVAYLKPGAEVRAHMADWDNATDAHRDAVAQAFEDSFNATLTDWYKKLRNWRKQANRPAEEITMGIPAKPNFEPGENRFFHEVLLARRGAPFSFRDKESKDRLLKPETKARIGELEADVAELEKSAQPEPARACAVEDKPAKERIEQALFIRGDYNALGRPTPLRFPAILAGLDQEPVKTAGSGRLELAQWMTSKDNPLTPRVIVNRVWQGHFGDGLVRTPDNFGKTGEKPTHPELLDWLTTRFMEDGWSIKRLHKRIMLSAAYQQSSEFGESKALADPENRLLSRFSRRRLDVEEIRDGLLTVDGTIDLSMGGTMQEGFGTDGENSNDRLSVNPDDELRRTVYLPLRRANLPALLNLFDFGDAATPMGKRAATNVAPQALFMMNSEFVAERARNLAQQLMTKDDAAARVRDAFLRTLNRAPGGAEVDDALTYISSVRDKFSDFDELDAWQSYCRILMASNEFIYVD
jgi:cytochrome c553